MYVDGLANIVSLIKKYDTLKVCIDFRDLNVFTLKDEYPMTLEQMIVDSEGGFEYLSRLDGYSGYHKFLFQRKTWQRRLFADPDRWEHMSGQ